MSYNQDITAIKPLYVKYPEEMHTAINTLVPRWKRFCRLEIEEKRKILYLETQDIGYEAPEGRNYDAGKKETLQLKGCLNQYQNNDAISFQTRQMLEAAQKVLTLVEDSMQTYMSLIKPHIRLNLFPKDYNYATEVTLRMIHYLPGGIEGEVIAAPHIDKGVCTLPLYESCIGLEHLNAKMEWKACNYSRTHIPIFHGPLAQIVTKGKVTGLCHRVVASKEAVQNGRYIIVVFIDTPRWSSDKRKCGSMQSHKRGFNYGMPYANLMKYFKQHAI